MTDNKQSVWAEQFINRLQSLSTGDRTALKRSLGIALQEADAKAWAAFYRVYLRDNSWDEDACFIAACAVSAFHNCGGPAMGLPYRLKEISADSAGAENKLLQLLDMTKTWNEKLLQEALKLYTEQGYFSEAEASVIRTNRILSVLRTDLCRRMGEAAAAGRLKREQPFVIGVAASEIDDAWPADETVLVQGMIDAYFEEDG